MSFSIRDKNKKIIKDVEVLPTDIKANVILDECHDNFWKLISYLQSLQNVETPKDKFSLVSQDEGEVVSALQGCKPESILSIIKKLLSSSDISLTQKDIDSLLKRREKLKAFKEALNNQSLNENWWQEFFEKNKWIFGYGLNYEILKQEQSQPHYGGTQIDGTGDQRGDYLMSTKGDLNFTVLVEIKTPVEQLLQGTKEIRNGAWSLSKELTDALSQIQANIQRWGKAGFRAIKQQGQIGKFICFYRQTERYYYNRFIKLIL